MADLKKITELPVAESANGINLIVNDNGQAKQIPARYVGSQADWDETDETSPSFIMNKPKETNICYYVAYGDSNIYTDEGRTTKANADELKNALLTGHVIFKSYMNGVTSIKFPTEYRPYNTTYDQVYMSGGVYSVYK